MEKIVYTEVLARFTELAKLTAEEAASYAPTVKSAQAYFCRLLSRDPTEEEKPLCEYACGCKAFFDYTVLRTASEKTFSSQTGGVFTRVSEDDNVKNAERLYKNALAALPEGLVRDDGFVFECTGC